MENPDEQSIAQNRSRRTKIDKSGRKAALERLKKSKESGERLKFEISEEVDVYEEVDEKKYSRIVQERLEDDWIVDDEGCGYVEDGREIFDEDLDDVVPAKAKTNKSKKTSNMNNPNIRPPDSKPQNIRSMFAAAAVGKPKPKLESEVSLNDDCLLGDIMAELKNENANIIPAPVKLKKKISQSAYNPFSSTPGVKRKPAPVNSFVSTISDVNKVKMPEQTPIKDEPIDEISSFDSQDIKTEPMDDYNIEDFSQAATTVKESQLDVSDINFDDEFGDSSQQSLSKPSKNKIPNEIKLENWSSQSGYEEKSLPDVKIENSTLPLMENSKKEQVLRMYWIDAYEDRFKQPGTIYLFGKAWIDSVKSFVSCCVTVKNIDRRVFLLPRLKKYNLKENVETEIPVTFIDLYKEFNENIAEKNKISTFKSRKVVKEYAFEKADVPAESEYLEVRYSASMPKLSSDLKGETFSTIFGTNTSSLETFLLDRKLKGPSWIDIVEPQISQSQISWCKIEAIVSSPENIVLTEDQLPIPPMVVMALSLKTLPNKKTHQNEIIGFSCLIHQNFLMDKPAPKPAFQQYICAISKPQDCVYPFDFQEQCRKHSKSLKIEIIGGERGLLGVLLAKIHKFDPDIIVGHDILGFEIDILLSRISHNKTPLWSKLGRIKKATMPKLGGGYAGKGGAGSTATSGRLLCDVKISSKELLRCRSYDLTELTSHILKEQRKEVDLEQIPSMFNSSAELLQLAEGSLCDSSYVLRIMYELMIIPLALQITNICGNVMSRTLMGGRAERNESLLLHAFTEKNFIVPDKDFQKTNKIIDENNEEDMDSGVKGKTAGGSKRRKPAYSGGLVLEPKKGFYDKYILLLDFNSLYPSIIQEYNICFTTVSRPSKIAEESKSVKEGVTSDSIDEDIIPELPDSELDPGILPTEIRKLVQSRRQVKQLMKTPDLSSELYTQYDIRQKALKLTANSMYGCLGFAFSRFYAKPLAALVTTKGREILMKTKDLVENMNLEVIYGDTDSIMINCNCTDIDQVFKLGNKVKSEVNKLYRLLEIDIDGVFKSMLLLKKKKYAALAMVRVGDRYEQKEELKGLDIVRRDWCQLAKEAGSFVVSKILSGESRDNIVDVIHTKLTEVAKEVADGKVPVEMFQITKQLTKNPEDYPDKKSLPHVQVALRLNSAGGGRRLQAGDTVYYVICEDGSNLAHSQRGYHPDELSKSDSLTIDTKYYLAQQIHPVVSRLCDPIDGTDAAQIADCLGLDSAGYRQSMRAHENKEESVLLGGDLLSDSERYRDCQRLRFSCRQCSREVELDSVFNGSGTLLECSLSKCPNVECKARPADYVPSLLNKLTIQMREAIKLYYNGWMKCEDSACAERTRRLPLVFHRGLPVCQSCKKAALQQEFTDANLYTQLCFYQHIFDVDRAISHLEPADKGLAHRAVKPYLEHYRTLRTHVEQLIKQSAYSQVNLTKLFSGLFKLKS